MSPWIIIVILGACAIAYAFIMPRKDRVQQPSQQLVQEMESTLEHYMTEIEQDNDALIQRVAELKGKPLRQISGCSRSFKNCNNDLISWSSKSEERDRNC